MKLSKRESIMIFALVFFVLIFSYWFLIFTPIQTELNDNLLKYDIVKSQYDSDMTIIDNIGSLKTDLATLSSQVANYENRLLPELDPEVITEHLVKILADNGFTKVTNISNNLPMYEQIQEPDGTYGENNVQWITINLIASGTDGVTPGGTDKVGYDQFIAAVKEIEIVNPNAIHISSISMQETNQGFQYFLVSIDVFAFNLPNRVSVIDASEPYITWNREPVAKGGVFGRTYDSIPSSQIAATFFRPFSSITATDTGIVQISPTPTP